MHDAVSLRGRGWRCRPSLLPTPHSPLSGANRIAEGPLDLLFFLSEVEEDVLGEAHGVLLGKVDPPVCEDRLQLPDGRVRHPDHRFRLPQGLLALRLRKLMASVQPLLVLLEALYKVPDSHGPGLYPFRSATPGRSLASPRPNPVCERVPRRADGPGPAGTAAPLIPPAAPHRSTVYLPLLRVPFSCLAGRRRVRRQRRW